jgi:hypothetical protein
MSDKPEGDIEYVRGYLRLVCPVHHYIGLLSRSRDGVQFVPISGDKSITYQRDGGSTLPWVVDDLELRGDDFPEFCDYCKRPLTASIHQLKTKLRELAHEKTCDTETFVMSHAPEEPAD